MRERRRGAERLKDLRVLEFRIARNHLPEIFEVGGVLYWLPSRTLLDAHRLDACPLLLVLQDGDLIFATLVGVAQVLEQRMMRVVAAVEELKDDNL